jgi:histidine ammonia-lyase
MTVTLTPGATSLAQLEAVWRGAPVRLDPSARPAVETAAARVAAAVAGADPVYGVNTGFGKLASVKIPAGDTARLQRNLILSHCSGVGDPTPRDITRLMMALKLLSLGRGASGVRWDIVTLLQAKPNTKAGSCPAPRRWHGPASPPLRWRQRKGWR